MDSAPGSLPVMVFIHGGCYTGGNGNVDGNTMVTGSKHPIIVVSMNYRLGILGFMGGASVQGQTRDGSSGNFGIQDQRLALQWVQNNIQLFGGNKSNVFLFGESAGAGSIAAHLVATKSAGLFHRAGIESGAFSLWNSVSMDQTQIIYNAFLVDSNCSSLDCLRNLSFTAAVALGHIQTPCQWHSDFAATVDGVEFSMSLSDLAQAGRFHRVDLLLGVNRDEGSIFASSLPPLSTGPEYLAWLAAQYPGHETAVLAQYPAMAGLREGYSENWWTGVNTVTDSGFLCMHTRASQWFSNANLSVYLYYFTHIKPGSVTCYHSMELNYVFHELSAITSDPDGAALSNTMLAYWVAFASTGSPNGFSDGSQLPSWPPYGTSTSYININTSTNITIGMGLKAEQCAFWYSIYPTMDKDCVPIDPKWPPSCGGHTIGPAL